MNFQMFKLDLEKAEEPEFKLPTSIESWKKQEFQKNIYFCFIDYQIRSDQSLSQISQEACGSQQTVENSSRDGNTRPPDLPLEKSVRRPTNNS